MTAVYNAAHPCIALITPSTLAHAVLLVTCWLEPGTLARLPKLDGINISALCGFTQEKERYMVRTREMKLMASQTAEVVAQLKALLRSQRSFGMQVTSHFCVTVKVMKHPAVSEDRCSERK